MTLNERPVYQPPSLLAGFAMADPALEACIEQTILDQRIIELEQFTRLRCTSAGLRSLSGLEQIPYLQEVDFSNNALNRIDSLFKLAALNLLRVVGNPQLDCNQLRGLTSGRNNLTVEAPSHCR